MHFILFCKDKKRYLKSGCGATLSGRSVSTGWNMTSIRPKITEPPALSIFVQTTTIFNEGRIYQTYFRHKNCPRSRDQHSRRMMNQHRKSSHDGVLSYIDHATYATEFSQLPLKRKRSFFQNRKPFQFGVYTRTFDVSSYQPAKIQSFKSHPVATSFGSRQCQRAIGTSAS